MPRGRRKLTPYVQVADLKMSGMCSICGKRGVRWGGAGCSSKCENYCVVTEKSCQRTANQCAGPYIMEHKVQKTKRDWGVEAGDE